MSIIKYSNLAYERLLKKNGESEGKWKKRVKIADGEEGMAKYMKRLKQARRKRIPPPDIISRYGRLLLWHLLYWYNEYRPGSEKLLDPLRKVKGLSHYGFDYNKETEKHFLSPVISRINVEDVPEIYRRNFSNYVSKRITLPKNRRNRRRRIMGMSTSVHAPTSWALHGLPQLPKSRNGTIIEKKRKVIPIKKKKKKKRKRMHITSGQQRPTKKRAKCKQDEEKKKTLLVN